MCSYGTSWPRCTAEPAIIGLTNAGSCCARSCMHIEIIANARSKRRDEIADRASNAGARTGQCRAHRHVSKGGPVADATRLSDNVRQFECWFSQLTRAFLYFVAGQE